MTNRSTAKCEHCGSELAYAPQGEYCPNNECPPYLTATSGCVGSETARGWSEIIDTAYRKWEEGNCHEPGCGCVTQWIKNELEPWLAQHDAQLVADLTAQNNALLAEWHSKWDTAITERDHFRLALADLTKPSPCEKPGHRMADCTEAKIVRPHDELTDRMVEDGWSFSGGQGEPRCLACEREEREKALAVGAALLQAASLVPNCNSGYACRSLNEKFSTYCPECKLRNAISDLIPEASKKALADHDAKLYAESHQQGFDAGFEGAERAAFERERKWVAGRADAIAKAKQEGMVDAADHLYHPKVSDCGCTFCEYRRKALADERERLIAPFRTLLEMDPFQGGPDGDMCLWCRRNNSREIDSWQKSQHPDYHDTDCEFIAARAAIARYKAPGGNNQPEERR